MYKKLLLILSFISLGFSQYVYSLDQQIDLRANAGTSSTPGDWNVFGGVYGRYSIQNEDPEDAGIKAVFALEANAGANSALFGIYQAYMKARITDHFRITVGKAPITWGEGLYYNSGDILFDSSNTGIILSSVEIRNNSNFLVDFYFPISRYSYFEMTAVIPTVNYFLSIVTHKPKMPSFRDTSGGFRWGGKYGGVQLQLGGMYLGYKNYFSSYFSMQGSLGGGVDAYINTRISTGDENVKNDTWYKTWEISAGLYYTQAVDAGIFTVRLETIFRPFKNWHAVRNPNLDIDPMSSGIISVDDLGNYDYYGNEIFFDISGNVSRQVSLGLRNVFSTIDASDYMSFMVVYSPLNNFSITWNTGVQVGEKEDMFNFDHEGGFMSYIQARYVFG